MNTAGFLIATSAADRVPLGRTANVLLGRTANEWDERIAAGPVALCDITELELLCPARGSTGRERLEREPRTHPGASVTSRGSGCGCGSGSGPGKSGAGAAGGR
ncbi:PIN domain nuclease [Streptomyces sp. t39]|uniref:PIN domain nuclease n=1 Tax=Streptomyces sp. t39 TaxID=1828156 RepID=UPI0011CEBAAB|nr:PIN domain nuclease [Streptomyces sp. t39]TXS55076.1 hypothetical protein EAO77_01810 [Streptomyces sp. t39]